MKGTGVGAVQWDAPTIRDHGDLLELTRACSGVGAEDGAAKQQFPGSMPPCDDDGLD